MVREVGVKIRHYYRCLLGDTLGISARKVAPHRAMDFIALQPGTRVN